MNVKPVVIYDGECRFCRKQVGRFQRFDRHEAYEFTARQTPGLDERFPILTESDFNTGLRFIEPDGTLHVGADAIHQLLRRLNPWRYLVWIYRIPGLTQLARLLYAWIARNRYRLGRSCDDGSCELPLAESRRADAESS